MTGFPEEVSTARRIIVAASCWLWRRGPRIFEMDWRRKLLRVCDDRIPVPERHVTIAEFADKDPSDMFESARRIHKEVKLTPLDLMSERWQSLLACWPRLATFS